MDDDSSVSISQELDVHNSDRVGCAPGVDVGVAESKISTLTMTLPGGGVRQLKSTTGDFYDQCTAFEAEGALSFVNMKECKGKLVAGIRTSLQLCFYNCVSVIVFLSTAFCILRIYIVHVCAFA